VEASFPSKNVFKFTTLCGEQSERWEVSWAESLCGLTPLTTIYIFDQKVGGTGKEERRGEKISSPIFSHSKYLLNSSFGTVVSLYL
jgi:hypothetical protein